MGVEEKGGYLIPVNHAVTVADLAKTLNAIVQPQETLLPVFNALKKSPVAASPAGDNVGVIYQLL